ncbi:hypothetical protein BH18ACT9_BH18ACT9_02640 [soil metagenome]
MPGQVAPRRDVERGGRVAREEPDLATGWELAGSSRQDKKQFPAGAIATVDHSEAHHGVRSRGGRLLRTPALLHGRACGRVRVASGGRGAGAVKSARWTSGRRARRRVVRSDHVAWPDVLRCWRCGPGFGASWPRPRVPSWSSSPGPTSPGTEPVRSGYSVAAPPRIPSSTSPPTCNASSPTPLPPSVPEAGLSSARHCWHSPLRHPGSPRPVRHSRSAAGGRRDEQEGPALLRARNVSVGARGETGFRWGCRLDPLAVPRGPGSRNGPGRRRPG